MKGRHPANFTNGGAKPPKAQAKKKCSGLPVNGKRFSLRHKKYTTYKGFQRGLVAFGEPFGFPALLRASQLLAVRNDVAPQGRYVIAKPQPEGL